MTNKQEVAYALSICTKTIDLEWPWTADTHSVVEKMRLLEPTANIWTKIDSYYQGQNVGHLLGSSFWKYKVCVDIRGGSSGRGHQTTVALSTTAIFGDLGGYFCGNFTDKTSNFIWW